MAGADRNKALDAALANIEKQFGKGSVMRLGDEVRAPLEVIPTGSIALDIALGLGGLPRGRVVEIYGPESSGKTTVALHAVANAQRAGGIVAFIDAEHALDPEYAKRLGVDTDALLVSQPDSGEQALEIADMLIRSGALDLIVIDSVAALVPRAEIEGEMGDSHVGLQARLMSQALRKMTGALNNSGTTAIFINQLREKIGVMFGSPETTTGGKALKFYASVRLDVRRIETLKDGTEMVGNRTRVKVVKNKVAPPFKQAEFDIMYGKGISREGGLIDVGVEAGLVRKAGAWYTYEGDQLGQGKENARTFLRDNPDLANELEKKILEKLGVGPTVDRARRRRFVADGPVDPDGRLDFVSRRPDERGPRLPRRTRVEPARAGRADPEAVARKILLDQLTGQARSRSELADKLAKQERARRRRDPAARPVRGGRAGRRRRVRARPGSPAGSPARGWPGGRSPRSCGARASTTRSPARRSTRSTPPTRRRRPGRWSRKKLRTLARRRRHGRDPAPGRHAGPQGLPLGALLRGGARGARRRTSPGVRHDGRVSKDKSKRKPPESVEQFPFRLPAGPVDLAAIETDAAPGLRRRQEEGQGGAVRPRRRAGRPAGAALRRGHAPARPVACCWSCRAWTPPARAACCATPSGWSTRRACGSPRSRRRPRRSCATTSCGGSGGRCPRPATSGSSTAPTTRTC